MPGLLAPPTGIIKPFPWPVDPLRTVMPGFWRGLGLAVGVPVSVDAVSRLQFQPSGGAVLEYSSRGPALGFAGSIGIWSTPALGAAPIGYPASVIAVMRFDGYFVDDWPAFLQIGSQDTQGMQFGLRPSVGAYIYNHDGGSTSWGAAPPVGEWMVYAQIHASATSHRVVMLSLEGNGTLVDSTTTTSVSFSSPTDEVIRIGAANNPSGGLWDGFDGQIAALYAYPRVVSDDELVLLHADPFAPFRPRRTMVRVAAAAGGGVDTEDKRRSVHGYMGPWATIYPVADGAIS